jgi:hypothetical protein
MIIHSHTLLHEGRSARHYLFILDTLDHTIRATIYHNDPNKWTIDYITGIFTPQQLCLALHNIQLFFEEKGTPND